jgi:hypothetical protein
MCSSRGSANLVDHFAPHASTPDEAIDSLLSNNSAMKWAIRALSFALAFIGILCFLQPIQAIADAANDILSFFSFIPILGWGLDFLGDVVAGAVGCVLFMVALGISAPTTFVVMAVIWAAMRPLLAVPALVLGAAGLLITVQRMVGLAKVGKQIRLDNKSKQQ